ncbi:hypothetical protein J4Q44_G00327800 [Coregonus suidteri]|uniref:SRCR domain-containing protein n=1 Tax=Coregonus suidteri TaxID=861788 RepID=A0AAN8KS66_9TELE
MVQQRRMKLSVPMRLCGSSFLLHAYSSTSGSWRTVCSDGLADHHGKAACQHLGYSSKTCPSVKGVTLKCIDCGTRVIVGAQEASLGPWQVSL